MNVVGVVVQVVLLTVTAPYLVGLMRQVRAWMEGRAGAGIGQPWRDLRKQLRKEPISPEGSTLVFVIAPYVVLSSALVIAAVGPFISAVSPLDRVADLFAVVALLLAAALAAAEVFMAKLRLFRVPELLAGSFLFGVLAVSSSFFLV